MVGCNVVSADLQAGNSKVAIKAIKSAEDRGTSRYTDWPISGRGNVSFYSHSSTFY